MKKTSNLATDRELGQRMAEGLRALLLCADCALQAKSDPSYFAVTMDELQQRGMTRGCLKWLIDKGYVEHAREVSRSRGNGRSFRARRDAAFSKRSAFVLSERGRAFAREVVDELVRSNGDKLAATIAIGREKRVGVPKRRGRIPVPAWDPLRRRFYVGEALVKEYRVPAINQELILACFQEEHWPERIDDPLPPYAEVDPKRRLRGAVKALNRKQKRRLIRFHVDGNGTGVRWELIAEAED